MIPQCIDMGVAVLPWSPLARGMLARPYDTKTERSTTDEFSKYLFARTAESDRAIVDALQQVAADLGKPMAQVAMAWLLSRPGITAPIVGVTRLAQLSDAVAAIDLSLDAETIAKLESPYVPREVVGLALPMSFRGQVSVRSA